MEGLTMVQREDVEFTAEGGVKLRGWLFIPERPGPHPAITMAHGYAVLRYHGLEQYARAFAEDGFVVLLHDHRRSRSPRTSGGSSRASRRTGRHS
jgi:hypothetical protein